MNIRWLLRMAHWSHNPPSERRVKFVLGIVVICLAVFALEYVFGWPEALSPNPSGRLWAP